MFYGVKNQETGLPEKGVTAEAMGTVPDII